MGSGASTGNKLNNRDDGPPTVTGFSPLLGPTVGPKETPTDGRVPSSDDRPPCPDEYILETPSIEVVRNVAVPVTRDALMKYFSNNRKSHGGKITSLFEDDDCYVITFVNMKDAQDVLSHNHVLMGQQLQVRHRKNPTIEVITDGTIDEERLKAYFTNTRASGGGPIDAITKHPNGVYHITFQHKRAAVDAVQKSSHFIEEKELVVSEKLSLIDAKILLIKSLPTGCTNGFLRDYLEGLDSARKVLSVAGIIRGEDATVAVVSLLHDIDGKTRRQMAKEVKEKPLAGEIISVSPMVITRSVQLSGITKRFTKDRLHTYFEDTGRSGGGQILDITTDARKGTAIIRFKDPTVVQRVVSKHIHEFGYGPISVCAHYEQLGTITEMDFTTSSTTPMDKTNIHRAIRRNEQKIVNVDPCKLRLLEKQLPTIRSAFPNVDFDIFHDRREINITGVEQEVNQAHRKLKSKLAEFMECRWSISAELQSVLRRQEIKKTIDVALKQANSVAVGIRNNEVVIWAVDKGTASTAESTVRDLFTENSRDVPKEVLGVGNWDNFVAQCNKDANFTAVMSRDKNLGKVKMTGIVQAVIDMNKKLDDFLKQVDTAVVGLDEAVVGVLVKGQTDLLQKIESTNQVKIDAVQTGFKVLGPRDRMKRVSDAIMDLASNVSKSNEQYKKPGLKKLFSKDTFQKLLKGIEENQRCSLQWDCKTQLHGAVPPGKKPSVITPQPATPDPSIATGRPTVGPITIDIQQGHLESESTDVIVNPVTSSTAFTVVGDALVKAGGQSIKDNFQTNWGSRVNGVLLTDAGTLRCKKVAHMVLPPADKLRDAVCQCLVLSNQARMTSIAFPAIGTGGFGLSPSQSAKAIRAGVEQFVLQNPTPVLTAVKLSIFTQRMVADYQAEFCNSPIRPGPPATGDITTPSPGQQEMSYGSVRMQVQQGDITNEKTDVVVSTILKDMGFTVVTNALVKAGGQSIADELKMAWPKRVGNVVFSDAGKLLSKKVAHMVIPSALELKDSVVACLKTADKLGMKSISFPAIGTGGSMSQAESARGIYSGVQEFGSNLKPQNLTLVRVTVYDSKMLGTFHSTMQQFSRTGHVPAAPGASSGKFGSVAVEIQQGDLTKETTDAVVNPVNTDGGFFAVGNALEQAGGAPLRTDCQKSWNERTNDVLVKDGGKLRCKKIIHVACPNVNVMKMRVLECLQQAEKNGLTSVAFPAIGTGGFGVSATDAARETIEAIKDFALTKNPGNVKLVRVAVFQASMVAEFQQALQATLPKAPIAPAAAVAPVAAVAAVAPAAAPAVKMPPNTNVEQVVEVTFLACNQMDMGNAKREVSQAINSHIAKGSMEDDRLKSTVRLLQQTEKDSIIQIGREQLVLVTITSHNIEALGLTEDVSGVLKEIECLLWEKKTAHDAEELKKEVIKVPDHWTTQPSGAAGAHIVSLQQTSPEYKDVEKTFLASVGYKPQIVSISRVQNEAKYKAYMLELKQREKRLGKSAIEKVLYHGTAQDVVDNINEGGFNRSYCGKNATAYGKGMYFARDASYSAGSTYSPPDIQGNKYIYQVRVIVGEYTTGKSGIVEPPPKNPSNVAVRYDSVVDNVQNPGIFVVFRDNEAYPEYLIVFK